MSEILSSGQSEQAALTQQISRITDVLASMSNSSQNGIQKMIDLHQRNFEKTAREQSDAAVQLANSLHGGQSTQMATIKSLDHTMLELVQAFRTDSEARSLLVNRVELQIQEYSARQDQFSQSVSQSITSLTEHLAPKPAQG